MYNDWTKNKLKQKVNKDRVKKAFSLIELLVSVSLFVIIILSATQIFKLVIDSQSNTIVNQNIQESLKYFLEVTGKEMRMAVRNDGLCTGVESGKVFGVSVDGDVLYFKNRYGECVVYQLTLDGDSQRFEITRNNIAGFISPKKIQINTLKFALNEVGQNQPVATVLIKASALEESRFSSELIIQTSITSRYYK
jgi:prepilin-type N-terminal cleavage/methylation domain-containing protein